MSASGTSLAGLSRKLLVFFEAINRRALSMEVMSASTNLTPGTR
jgi:hypothetical protein